MSALHQQSDSVILASMETMQRVGVICLTNGGCTIVDPDKVEELSVRRWSKGNGYARSGIRIGKKTTPLLLHRVVFGAQQGQCLDHINGDKLDNRLCNLRLASKSQNSANAKKRNGAKSTSLYKGVSWNKGAWCAQINSGGQRKYLGRFQSQLDAAKAYNAAALKLFGEYARFNELPA